MGVGSFKALTFDGIVSTDYGVYITGEGVYNAPQRAAEVVAIPGRNGAFIQDLGRFDNIQVTYTAGVFGTDQANFAAKIDAYRNALASRYGYCRLEDEYHTDEYREAAFLGGLEVEPAGRSNAGEFSITFECKPQRFLKTGETAAAITSGDTLTNPTPFDARPLLMVDGYGAIAIGSDIITITDAPIGLIKLAGRSSDNYNETTGTDTPATSYTTTKTVDLASLNTGDAITGDFSFSALLQITKPGVNITDAVIYGTEPAGFSFWYSRNGEVSFTLQITEQMTKGASGSDTINATIRLTINDNGTTATANMPITCAFTWDGSGGYTLTTTIAKPGDFILLLPYPAYTLFATVTDQITAYSTKGSLGHPLYLDLDIGEAYKYENAEIISVNNAVTFGVSLPTLPAGNTAITYDNTITSLEIVPRWWTV